MQQFVRYLMIPLLSFSFLLPGGALAGVTGTEAMLAEQSAQTDARAVVDAQMARDDVRAQMLAMGVDPAAVEARIDALSEAELAQLAENIESAPAGGVLGVVGAVFVVLLILELVGVIDIFKGI